MVADERVLYKIVVVEEMSRTVKQLVKAVVDTVMDYTEVDGCCSIKLFHIEMDHSVLSQEVKPRDFTKLLDCPVNHGFKDDKPRAVVPVNHGFVEDKPRVAFCLGLRFVMDCVLSSTAFCLFKTICCVLLRTNSAKIKTALRSRDRPPMLAPGRYPQWRSRFLRYVDTRPNDEALRKCIMSGPYKPTTMLVHAVKATDDSPAVPELTTVETPTNMSPENKAYFLAEKEAIHLILTGIGDDIYSTVDACQIAQEI
uniref:Uncharacterized protein n=1 Tax=Tanacetum cinerariifolium TaxID=118510 RepID=A0A6L2N0U9_TANCI|nr:hypothetical protein [Tanacetum cinerariifolium]